MSTMDILPDGVKAKAMEAVAEALGEGTDCLRVWSAWSVGTMSQDDFVLIAESPDRVKEITEAALGAVELWLKEKRP